MAKYPQDGEKGNGVMIWNRIGNSVEKIGTQRRRQTIWNARAASFSLHNIIKIIVLSGHIPKDVIYIIKLDLCDNAFLCQASPPKALIVQF